MEEPSQALLYIDIATGALLSVLGLVAYMRWYLRKNVTEDQQYKVRNCIWLETLFYFRDLTQARQGSPQLVYPLVLILLVTVLAIFGLNVFRQLHALDPLARYGIGMAIGVVLAILVSLFRKLSRRDYRL